MNTLKEFKEEKNERGVGSAQPTPGHERSVGMKAWELEQMLDFCGHLSKSTWTLLEFLGSSKHSAPSSRLLELI